MSSTATAEAPGSSDPDLRPAPPERPVPAALALLAAGLAVVALSAVHLTQGTSAVGALDLLRIAFGGDDQDAARVLVASRLPRLLAGVAVGVALGIAGAVLQSLARNPLASPDTLAINAGAHLAVVLSAAFGFSLAAGVPFLGGMATLSVAFFGGLAAAGLVLLLSAGGASGPTRLILAGAAIALALNALTMLFLVLKEQETVGLFAWGSGSLVQIDLTAVTQTAPVIALAVAACFLLGHRLDILALGDDTASVLGVPVRRTRLAATLLAVLLATSAVTLAGPIGFVGLCAPAIVRLLGSRIPRLHRHRLLFPLAGLTGVVVVLAADVAVRAALGGQAGVDIPTGVVTTIAGALLLVWLARGYRGSGPARQRPAAHAGTVRGGRAVALVLVALSALVVAALAAGMLLGDTGVLTGDIVNWMRERTGPALTFVLDQRYPRVLAALLAGAALAVAGAAVQAVCRNPLAEPGLLGITAGAGVGAVALITLVPLAGAWTLSAVAGGCAVLTFAAVYGLAWRAGLDSDRLVLIGIGVWMGGNALITFLIVAFDPWNTAKALTWLSGSTYGRTPAHLLPVAVALVVLVPVIALAHRELDVLALDDDTPRVLGIRLERTRLVVLGAAALLTATAVAAVGVIGFVGLVAPHMARALVGGRHSRVIPVAALLGALLISLADTLGRTVIAPAQIPAGLLTAMVGTPYFVWLLWRTRAAAAR
ncbi:iron complex transport system permease protein [Prauserella shujinwangii]|uniref:Iron complex transport system permease protein n=1 Tax=Prauserella shujinwangii TaxID=1453103 RepID=A0A2T0LKP5_9PSEU|nr:iron ABC transporter permease [Prauserella shujinwangii]PRX43479.1 iron complex transport system permease protein [Prauserella shujinwangii]